MEAALSNRQLMVWRGARQGLAPFLKQKNVGSHSAVVFVYGTRNDSIFIWSRDEKLDMAMQVAFGLHQVDAIQLGRPALQAIQGGRT